MIRSSRLLWLGVLWCWLAPHAQGQAMDKLEVHAGATCLEATRVAERVAFWLADFPIRSDFRVEVRGSAIDPRSMEVVLRDEAGNLTRRNFEPGPERCADLHDAAGLSVALLIKAATGAEASAGGPSTAPERPLQGSVELPPPPARVSPRVRLERPRTDEHDARASQVAPYRVAALVAGGPGLRLASELSHVVHAALSLRLSRLLVLEPGFVVTGARAHPLGERGSYTSRTLGASLSACLDLHRGPSHVLAWCLGGWAGRTSLRGMAFSAEARKVSLRLLSLTTGPRIAWSVSERLSLLAVPELVVGAQPIEVVVLAGDAASHRVERLPRAGVALMFGLSYALLTAASPTPPPKRSVRAQGFPSWAHE